MGITRCGRCGRPHDTLGEARDCCADADDGGVELTTACPFCDSARVCDRSTLDPRFRCLDCQETFDESRVVHRPVRMNGGSPYADALTRADPDDVATDGGAR